MAVNEGREGYKKTQLGWIPAEWETKKIGKLFSRIRKPVKVKPDEIYQEIGIRSHGKGIFHKEPVTGKKIGNKSVFWIEPDCLVLNIVFAWEQAVAKTTNFENGKIASHRFPMYKAKPMSTDLDYVLYYFKSPRGKHSLGLASPGGAGRNKTLGQGEFSKLKIPYPPYPEQKKIAEILSIWDKGIELTEKLIQAKTRRKKGLMQQLLTGKKRFGEFVKLKGYKETKLGVIPEDWDVHSLKELGEFKNGINKDKNDFGFGYPFVNLMDVFGKAKVGKSVFGVVNTSERELKDYDLKKGDILFVRSSVKPSGVGLTSLIYEDLTNTTFSGFLIRFRPKKNAINFIYKQHCFHEAGFRRRLLRSSTISANTNINQQSLKNLSVALPPLPEQQKIAAVLTACDKEVELLNQKLEALKQQKKGLMQKLLTGQIRVN